MTLELSGKISWMDRSLSYGLALLSAGISILLYLEIIGEKLSGARIPQSINTPCSLFFLALALIFAAFGLAERPDILPEISMVEDDTGPEDESEDEPMDGPEAEN